MILIDGTGKEAKIAAQENGGDFGQAFVRSPNSLIRLSRDLANLR
jgi:hypothetical protein